VSRFTGLRGIRLVAMRELVERVRSRAFLFSTLLLAGLAVVVAMIPLGVRLFDRATVSKVAVVSAEPGLASYAAGTLDQYLNVRLEAGGAARQFAFDTAADEVAARNDVLAGRLTAAISLSRTAGGGLVFRVFSAGSLGTDRAQLLQVGAFAVGILDWTASQPSTLSPFVQPGFEVLDAATGGAAGGGAMVAVDAADYAGRRIVGIVLVVLSFLTLVFYGMWVASGVVAEKTSRVMELLISAATAQDLVIGKIVGIGIAGLVQVLLVLAPALTALVASSAIGDAVLGPGSGVSTSLGALSPVLLGAFLVYFVLGFALYAALYAAAGSLLSRAEDLQIIALPLSIPAVAGYFPAVLALSGSSAWFIRVASFVPFWSPFVMLSRIAVGRAEPWEVALSLLLLVLTVPLVTLLAIRVYRAGVLMYGQPPSLRTFVRAIRGG
jgi:ABC-2 type transport system permease protein